MSVPTQVSPATGPQPNGQLTVEILNDSKEVVQVRTDGAASEYSSQPSLDYAGSAEKTDPEEIKLAKKLDLWILPMLWFMNFLNFTQRGSISVAPLGGLNRDLGLQGTQFSTVIAVHYLGYILGQVPSNLILTRVRASRAISLSLMMGSAVTLCIAAVNDYKGLVLQRFFLGVITATCWPGSLYMISSFYKRKEIGTRMGVLYSSNILSTAFQSLIAAPVFSELSGVNGLNGWKWLFIILGAISGFVSIIGVFVLPNEPLTTWWLTPQERQLAHQRMISDTVEKEGDVSLLAGLKQCVKDKRLWIFIFMHQVHTASSSFRNFLPTLLSTLGYNTTITLVISAPPYLFSAIVGVIIGLTSGKWNERTWHMTCLKLTAMMGFILACATMNTGARLLAAFIFVGANYSVTSITLGWVGITCAQTREKRAAALAMVNTSASISLLWSPYLWPTDAAPRYVLPMASSAGFCLFSVLCIWMLSWSLRRENKRIRREDENATLFYAY